jgi:poly(A) polymerase
MCATHNITRSTKEIIQKELQRGGQITERIMTGKASWKDLFVKHSFFTEGYKYYLSVITASTNKDAQLKWSGLVESKVRHLVVALEAHDSIAIARPFNKGFERVHRCKTDEQVEKAKSGNLECQVKEESDEVTTPKAEAAAIVKEEVTNGEHKSNGDAQPTMVYTMTHYIGLQMQPGKWTLFSRSTYS